MKAPAAVSQWITRFDRMSMRERLLIAGALLALLVEMWDTCLMQPLNAQQQSALTQLATIQDAMRDAAAQLEAAGAGDANLQQQFMAAKAELNEVNRELGTSTAGLIAPQRMSTMLYDMLRQQHAVKLVSLRNLPAHSLVTPPRKTDSSESTDAASGAHVGEMLAGAAPVVAGPYLHPVELVIEGHYLDILAYTRSLEALPWRFYWKRLDLDARYPLSRARIELCTLSLDADWMGV